MSYYCKPELITRPYWRSLFVCRWGIRLSSRIGEDPRSLKTGGFVVEIMKYKYNIYVERVITDKDVGLCSHQPI